ncbi:9722_t:CDS:2 [Diversispora eburnea]|uniref:9722_t:CDS:1 n=1 Tax=Diversispora eburnea TaxID=1213867 RepID=A0A9N8V689_9GLOM|nr:9722_t:CDS:2 [Diversispora eburnea]
MDLDNLDLNRIYTFEEFEYINDQPKYHTLEINGQPVNHFELDKNMEAVVSEIVRQLGNGTIRAPSLLKIHIVAWLNNNSEPSRVARVARVVDRLLQRLLLRLGYCIKVKV